MARITGTRDHNTLKGTRNDDFIAGINGKDYLIGGHGNDRLRGGPNNDQMRGGVGNDTLTDFEGVNDYRGGDGDDLIKITNGSFSNIEGDRTGREPSAGEGFDWVDARAYEGRLELALGDEPTLLDGAPVADIEGVFVGDDGGTVDARAMTRSHTQLRGGSGDDHFRGTVNDDRIQAGDGHDFMDGQAGDDVLDGKGGNDTLFGNAGDDKVRGGDGDDILEDFEGRNDFRGGAGDDRIKIANDSFWRIDGDDNRRKGDVEEGFDLIDASEYEGLLVLELTDGVSSLDGAVVMNVEGVVAGDDGSVIDASDMTASHTHLTGGRGRDVFQGTDLGDLLKGRGGDDVIDGNAGRDVLHGGFGDDTMRGGRASDLLRGGEGNDVLRGNHGDDRLFADGGRDWLRGGRGDDKFVFGADDGKNTIQDFSVGDLIDLRPTDAEFEDLSFSVNKRGRTVVTSDEFDTMIVVRFRGPGEQTLTEDDFLF